MIPLRRLLLTLSGLAWLVAGLLIGASSPAAATDASGCTGDVVVAFGARLLARPGEDVANRSLATPVPPGVYRITAVSRESYDGRADVIQPHEHWTLELRAGGRSLGVFGPTTDVPDGVDEATVVDDLGTVTIDEPVDMVRARHALRPVPGGTDSVGVVCVGLARIASPGDALVGDATVDCPSGAVVVSVANQGGIATAAEIVVGAAPPVVVDVSGNGAVDHRAAIGAPITNVSVRSVPDGRAVFDTSLDSACRLAPPTPPPATPPPPTSPPAPPAPPAPSPPPAAPRSAPSPLLTAAISVDCSVSEASVALTNDGGATVVDLAVPESSVVSNVEVASGASATTSLSLAPGLEDTVTEVRVLDATSGELFLSTDFAVDCLGDPVPTAEFVVDCARDTLVVTLGNAGDESTELTVIHERVQALDPVVVAGGDQIHVELDITGSELPLRVVDIDGVDVIRSAVGTTCTGVGPVGPPGDPAGPSDPDDPETPPGRGDPGGPAAADDPETPPAGLTDCTGAVEEDSASCEPVLHVAVVIDCDRGRARVEIGRFGEGRERVVVLADGVVRDVVEVGSIEPTTVFVPVEGTVEITVSRPAAGEIVAARRVSCGDDAVAGAVAASLVVVAVLASAAGVYPWPPRAGIVRA